MTVYLDYASTTPVDERVAQAMQPYLADKFYNPSAQYLAAKDVRRDINQARGDIAKVIGSKQSEIVFTAGATEANNLAISGVMECFPGKNLVVSSIEHDSVIEPAKNYKHSLVKVDEFGIVDLESLRSAITDDTVLVSIMQANNEIGVVQPIKLIAELIAEIKVKRRKNNNELPLYLHTDSAQATNYLDIHVSRLGIDLMSVNGGKIYGPKQTGFLFIKTGVKIIGQIQGGGQERGLRSGTENVPGIVGLATALKITTEMRSQESRRMAELQHYFYRKLDEILPNLHVNGSKKLRLPNNIHVTIPGIDNERAMMELDERGVMCAVGSACSASKDEPSHVLKAIGLSDELARSSLRFTMGRATTKNDIDFAISALKDSCQQA